MGPWLQQPTATSVRVLWESDEPSVGRVGFASQGAERREVRSEMPSRLHEVVLDGLTPGVPCAYDVEARTPDGRTLGCARAAFTPAPPAGTPIALAVVGDTQDQPDVWARVAARVFAERPAFLLHCGDIVGDGHDPTAWREEFFGPARTLLAHVPFLAVLGNHEGDSPLYYRYVSNPEPEHRCSLRYGDLEVFLVDSERPTEPGSEQHAWLDGALGASRAPWRVVVLHRPPWSSDLDDYGNACRAEAQSGDPRSRPLIPLFEKHRVDVVFCGHVHDYERTWPILEGRVDEARGVTYVQTGGAGGYGETHAPTRSWFTAHVRACHHFLIVNVLGATLDLKAYDDEGRLFDHWVKRKAPALEAPLPRAQPLLLRGGPAPTSGHRHPHGRSARGDDR